MKKILLVACSLVVLTITAMAGHAPRVSLAKGYVFEDLNDNGKRDRGERGIAGVGVCNGRGTIVQTDEKGYYEVPVGNDNIVFVIKPAGYALPLDKDNMPIYYYVYKPQGTPDANWRFKGCPPTGKLPSSIDFALRPSDEPTEFKALIFGDPQVRTEIMLDFFDKKIVNDVGDGSDYAFGIGMGDVSDEDLNLMGRYREITGRIGTPWYNVVGNHDSNYDAMSDSLSTETFVAHFGPADYSFNYANAHVLVLDNLLYPDPRNPMRKSPWAGFRQDQRDFIENDLKLVPKDKLVIVAAHVPFIDNWVRTSDIRFLFMQLGRFENVLLLTAHLHTTQHIYYGEKQGWFGRQPLHEINVGATCGSWYSGFLDENGFPEARMTDGTPQGYVILNVKNQSYSVDYKTAGKPIDYQMIIHHPKVVMQDRHTPSYIVVNYFMGYKDDRVEFRLDDGEWKLMKHTLRTDPTYAYMFHKWELSEAAHPNRWPSHPSVSKHIWQARIPVYGVPVGKHRIEIRATDRFGNVHRGESWYRIEPVNNPNQYP